MRSGLLFRTDNDRLSHAMSFFLFLFVLVVGAAYGDIACRIAGISQNDGAYYYGVARHIAVSGRFEEPIVWHFIRPPETIVHAPFDYWGCMTSLLLVPSLMLFGANTRTAFVTMSAITAT